LDYRRQLNWPDSRQIAVLLYANTSIPFS
jgi:hypothetical protein